MRISQQDWSTALVDAQSWLHGDEHILRVICGARRLYLQAVDCAIAVQGTVVQVVFVKKVELLLLEFVHAEHKTKLVINTQVRAQYTGSQRHTALIDIIHDSFSSSFRLTCRGPIM